MPPGFKRGLSRLCRGRLGDARRAGRTWRAGAAAGARRRGDGGSGLGQYGLLAVHDADARRGRGAQASRLAGAAGGLAAEAGHRRMDRDDEPDRAAGGLGRRRAEDPRRARPATAATGSPARRSSSPTASTTWPTTSSTSSSPACPTRRRGRGGSRCSWCPRSCPTAARNDLRCVSIEHKLGIHASPTCVMAYGDEGGATGWLIGEENKRHGGDVHDDEQCAPQRRPAGRRRSPSGRRSRRSPMRASACRAAARGGRRGSSNIPTCGGCCCG